MRNPFPIWAIALGVIAGLTITLLLYTSFDRYSAADLREVCSGHYGVQQVTDTTWTAGKGVATVVCRDGYVKQVG